MAFDSGFHSFHFIAEHGIGSEEERFGKLEILRMENFEGLNLKFEMKRRLDNGRAQFEERKRFKKFKHFLFNFND